MLGMDGWCRGGERLRVTEEVQVIVGVFEVGVGEDGRELEKKRKRVRRCGTKTPMILMTMMMLPQGIWNCLASLLYCNERTKGIKIKIGSDG